MCVVGDSVHLEIDNEPPTTRLRSGFNKVYNYIDNIWLMFVFDGLGVIFIRSSYLGFSRVCQANHHGPASKSGGHWDGMLCHIIAVKRKWLLGDQLVTTGYSEQ